MDPPDDTQFDQVLLAWDDFQWRGDIVSPLLGETIASDIELSVNTKDEEHMIPCDEQLQSWKKFLESNDEQYQNALNEILGYYRRMRPQYVKAGPEWAANMPNISSTHELESMIGLSAITITWPYEDSPLQIGSRFSCDWDTEHGLGVVFQAGQVVDVGGADCAIL